MSAYKTAIKEALKSIGLKKVLEEVLILGGAVQERKSVGQIVVNVNSGGVTQVQMNNWKVE